MILHRWREAMRITDRQKYLVLTIATGAVAGLSSVLFALGISLAHRLMFGLTPSTLRLVLVPVLASAVAGVLLQRFFADARGSGVPQTKAAYHLRRGVIAPLVPIGKFLTGILCIGSGQSLGREGPSVQIGAGLASAIGQWLGVPPDRLQRLVPVGASAALAAAFNTPIAAVLFTLEELIGDMNAPMLGSTVVASVVSVIIARSILGNEPLFHVPDYRLVHPGELVAYAALGVVGGGLSLAFTQGLLATRRVFRSWPAWTVVGQPAVGGVLIGVVLVVWPGAAGVGYDLVNLALNSGLTVKVMLVFCLVKLVATIVSYASGNAGGVFGPSLFLGAMAGGIVGVVTRHVAPFAVADPGVYALVGMGTLFAGIIRAPMTSVFMIFEITQDYQIVVPLMLANLLAFSIARHYQREPLYHALLKQEQVHLPDPQASAPRRRWRARDVMASDYVSESVGAAAGDVLRRLADDAPGVVAIRGHAFVGVVTRAQLERAVADDRADTTVGALTGIDGPHVHQDQSIDVVFDRLRHAQGLLPVVGRDDAHRLDGVVTHASVTSALIASEDGPSA